MIGISANKGFFLFSFLSFLSFQFVRSLEHGLHAPQFPQFALGPDQLFPEHDPVQAYIDFETPIALRGMLANIGPNGSKCQGAKPGVVVASPSRVDPDYVFTWVRDSALVFKHIVDTFISAPDPIYGALIDDFVSSQAEIQRVRNPSGSTLAGGLGEPKFLVDETSFEGNWGRPQRDSPALRAITIISYASWHLDNSNDSYVQDVLWPIAKLDLDYVATFWNKTTFDLWEEVSSSSYFSSAVQHKALRQGIDLAKRLGVTEVPDIYELQAGNVLCFLQSYWNSREGFTTANTDKSHGRSGKDSNTILTSIHTFDPEAGCDPVTFQPCSDKALSNLKVYVDSFRHVYSINKGIAPNASVAVGRYAEDFYQGGNPWYLSTFAVSEQLYDALIVWNAAGELNVTSISLAFFRQFIPEVETGTYPSSTSTYTILTEAIKVFADGFILENAKYTPRDGSLAEQYDRNTGNPKSALDLTWSYASSLTAFGAREGNVPKSWGAVGLEVPAVCSSGPEGGSVKVTFSVLANTFFGENIYITGSTSELGDWSPEKALHLSPEKYPIWSVTVELPAVSSIEYKYIRKFDGRVTWESGRNNKIETPVAGETPFVDDKWRN